MRRVQFVFFDNVAHSLVVGVQLPENTLATH